MMENFARPAALAAIVMLTPNASLAQEVQSERLGAFTLEQVIVTANRREQSLQDVAMSVTAFTSDFFADSGIRSLNTLDQYTPSLKILPGSDARSTSIRIRGIGSVGSNAGIDPSVGLFIDGVYQGRAGMSIADLIDIERVEILRGPQGTLYGKNTAAGAINILTARPSADLEGLVEVNYNSDKKAEIHGTVNVPFGDSGHAARLTGFVVKGDHLYENEFTGQGVNDANKWGIKSRVLFDTGAFMDGDGLGEFLLTADYTKEDTDCCAFAAIEYEGFSTLNTPATNSPTQELSQQLGLNGMGDPILRWNSFEDSEGFSPPKSDPFSDDYWYNAELYNKVNVGGIALEWNKEIFAEHALFGIAAWRHYESDSAYDGDFTGFDAVVGTTDIELDQYSLELRIESPGGETFDYQGGLYYYYSELDSLGSFEQREALVNNVLINVGDLTLGEFFPNGTLNTDTNEYITTSYAAFGQLVWSLNDNFSMELGLRYTYEEKDRKGSQITTPESNFDIPPVVGPNLFYDEGRSDDDISPSLTAKYFITEDIMAYASVARGFKSGGFNQRRELEGLNGEFDEETATNYELGWKASSEDNRLIFNGTFYFVTYDDFQAQAFDGESIRVTNAGSMESYGLELETTYTPLSNLILGTAIGYNKAEYVDFENGQCTVAQEFDRYYGTLGSQSGAPGTIGDCIQDLSGKEVDNTPEWTVSSFVQYDREITERVLGIARLEYNYTDSYYLDQDLDENLRNDAVNLVNVRFTLASIRETWEVSAWGSNLLDEEYYGIGLDTPILGGYIGIVAPGAVYGATLRLRY